MEPRYKPHLALEQIKCITTCSLQVAPESDHYGTFVAVGTSQATGEDGRALGNIYILEIVRVVPDPDRKGSHLKLKLYSKTQTKAPVTAIRNIETRGVLAVAMGQKVHIRGLTDHRAFIASAFTLGGEYTTALKTLEGTDMFLIGDAGKGLSFCGYQVRLSLLRRESRC